jgi:predicted permease
MEAELQEELRFHLEREVEENLARGMDPEEARRAALRGFGGVARHQEQCRDERGLRLFEELRQDLRHVARMSGKNPGFALTVILMLGLGVGANTAIFSVINGVLLRPLALRDPERLLLLWTDNPAHQLGFREFPAANADLPEWREKATSFEGIAALTNGLADLSDSSDSSDSSGSSSSPGASRVGVEPERVGAVQGTADLLPLLGVRPFLGRYFSADEEQWARHRVAIISYALWQRRFGGDPEILGRTITVNRVPRKVIGVMPEGFHFTRAAEMPQIYNLPEKTELWLPMSRDANYWHNRAERNLVVLIGRLKAGVTQAQAQADMDGVAARQAADDPLTHGGWRVWLTPLLDQTVGRTRAPLLVLLGAVGLLLLIACANIASLLLARAAERRREIAVRAAIGAGRARIVRQLLTESLALAALGGGLGLALGYWGLGLLLRLLPQDTPRLQDVSLDARVFLFTASTSLLTGALFGLAPAWQASKVNLVEALKDAGRANSSGRGLRGRRALVTVEVALVAVLLVGALLTLQSFRRLLAVDPGFDPQGVAAFEVLLPWARYGDGAQRAQFFEQARARIGGLPGVRAVGAVSNLPLSGSESMNFFAVEGAPPPPPSAEPIAEDRVVTPGYFEAMGINLLSGRGFEASDGPAALPVAVVNESLARRFFPKGDAVGGRIKLKFGDDKWRTIVGVVRDVRGFALETQARPQLYHPNAQDPVRDQMVVAVRADARALPFLPGAVRRELKQLDAAIPVANYRTMPELMARALARQRFITLFLGLFAAVALLLSVVGLYGVVAYGVSQRTREIGVRMALGARRRNVVGLVIGQGMRPALVGMLIGMFGAFALSRFLAGQLYEIKPTDPATFAAVALGLLFVSLAACYFPARRAADIDPMASLRCE